MKLGISVQSGIMNLSLTSDEFTSDELLDIYNSYHSRKKWYRLSSGDFVDLSDDSELRDMDQLLTQLDLSTPELIGKKASLPVYRALYLDRIQKLSLHSLWKKCFVRTRHMDSSG